MTREIEARELERLLSGIAGGEPHTLEKPYILTKDALYGYALSMLKNSHDAEDVLHDAYVSVYHGAAAYRPQGKPMAWLFTIVRNLCTSNLRRRKRGGEGSAENWEAFLESREGISPEDRLLLSDCLKKLGDEEREILLLHGAFGLKHREIAQLTDRPLPTVLSKYHRARRKMQTILSEESGK